jgi:hypothetical protein
LNLRSVATYLTQHLIHEGYQRLQRLERARPTRSDVFDPTDDRSGLEVGIGMKLYNKGPMHGQRQRIRQ